MITHMHFAAKAVGTQVLRIASAVLLVLALVAASAAAAEAAVYDGGGVFGFNGPATVTCRHMAVRGQIRTETPPPKAFAYNRTAGGGNDWQQVRYRLLYRDATTGAVVASSNWSPLAWAGDNTPAQWSGTTMWSFDWRAKIRVDTHIQYYNRNGAYEGFLSHKADRYHYFDGFTTYPTVLNQYCEKSLNRW
jgi:hypothetical protein